MSKRPAFQFYPADWRKDMALQSCSLAAQGLWMNLLCIAHECVPYGHLVVNGKPMTAAHVARLTGLSERECTRLIDELDGAGVIARTEEGAIYSRRMVRDEALRNVRAEGGKAGSEHGHKGAQHGKKGGRPRKETGDKKPPLNPPPSSSSSSSEDQEHVLRSTEGSNSRVDHSDPPPDPCALVAGEACRRLKREAHLVHVHPGDPHLVAALQAGVTTDELVSVALEHPNKPLAYIARTAVGRRNDAAQLATGGTHGIPAARPGRTLSAVDRVERAAAAAGFGDELDGGGGRVIDVGAVAS